MAGRHGRERGRGRGFDVPLTPLRATYKGRAVKLLRIMRAILAQSMRRLISSAPVGAIDAALEAAQATVPTLRDLGFEADEARAVAEAIEAIRADLLGEEEPAAWH